MNALITQNQLRKAITSIKNFITEKFGYSANAQFGSVDIDGVVISHDKSNHTLVITGDGEREGAVEINFPSAQYTDRIPTVDGETGEMYVEGVITDSISDGTLVYSLPRSSSVSNGKSADPNEGGGVILTTKFRSIPITVYDGSQHSVVLSATQSIYHLLQNITLMSVKFTDAEYQGFVNEYWIDITFDNIPNINPSVTFMDKNNNPATLYFADGEPDWSSLAGRRVQLHIVNDIVTYVII